MDLIILKFQVIFQLQGYDKCQYINTMYPWEGHDELRPPHISKTYNPVGSYVTFF